MLVDGTADTSTASSVPSASIQCVGTVSMSAARAAIVAQVAPLAEAAQVKVEAYARNSVIDEPTVMVRVDRITKTPPWRTYEAALLVLVPQTVAGNADDELDGLLEDVLEALEVALKGSRAVWTTAERAVYQLESGSGFPCYEVALRVPMSNHTNTTQE